MVVLAAVAGREASEASGSGENVPEVAEVDIVVEIADRLGARLATDHASTAGGVELEELVVSVLLVLGEAGAPDVVIVGLLLEVVDALSGAGGVRVPSSDLGVDEGVEGVA